MLLGGDTEDVDLNGTIRDLRAEIQKIDAVIAQLEALNEVGVVKTRSTRGRKAMGESERREVSERMKRYWASRRKARG
jgi:hypothetical protein